jgi:hypothetical protein
MAVLLPVVVIGTLLMPVALPGRADERLERLGSPVSQSVHDVAAPPRRPGRDDVLRYRGLLADLKDDAGRVIWTPALPGAPAEVRRDWLRRLAAAGATHVPIGPFSGGPVYPGVQWPNPDWTDDPQAIRALLLEIFAVPSAAGHGLVPVIFLDGGAARPGPRLARIMPTLSLALEGIGPSTATVPCGWEPYDWSALECSRALRAWKPQSQGAVIAWHGGQGRVTGVSDPVQPDDPWKGNPAAFYKTHGGEFIDTLYFQSIVVRTRAEADCGRTVDVRFQGVAGKGYPEKCWKRAAEEAIAQVGASVCPDPIGRARPCDWRRLPVVAFETTAYHQFRGDAEPGVAVAVANAAAEICRNYSATCGFGNGLPGPAR